MKGFTTTQTIPFRGAEGDFTASFPCVMACMLEASLRHNEATPYSSAWYLRNGMGFVLTNWQAEVYKYPAWNEEITVNTWPTSHKGFVAERSFEMLSQDGKRLAASHSAWVFLDLNRRRPIRPTPEIIGAYGEEAVPVLERDFRLPERDVFTEAGRRIYTVSKRDIDVFRHVNSVTYIDWAIDALAAFGCAQDIRVTAAKIGYRKECIFGAEVEIAAFRDPERDGAFAVNIEEAGSGALLCEMYLKFGEI